MVFVRGQTAIIVPVGAAEPIVGHWRKDFDPAAAASVPAHITIIYPFLAQQDINDEVMGDLRRLIAHQASFTVTFAHCGQFPDVLFLVPDPDDPFRRLTAELVQRWPQAPPYAGLITDPIPHLTITHGAPAKKAAEAQAEVTAHLPFSCPIQQAWLIKFDGTQWARWTTLPLGAAHPG